MRRLLSRHWLGVHAVVLLAVAAFLALGWWQAIRAGDGNARSYGYAAEWPTFALIVLFLWIRAMRTELRSSEDATDPAAATRAVIPGERELVVRDNAARAIAEAEAEDDELAAYNRYLGRLHRRDLQHRR